MPLWSGEYGYWGDDADRDERLSRYADLEDEYLLGSAYWVWKQACGDPQGGINDMTDCAHARRTARPAKTAPARDDLLEILSRAYPRSRAGRAHVARPRRARMLALAGTTDDARLRARGVDPRHDASPTSRPPASRTSRRPRSPAAGA